MTTSFRYITVAGLPILVVLSLLTTQLYCRNPRIEDIVGADPDSNASHYYTPASIQSKAIREVSLPTNTSSQVLNSTGSDTGLAASNGNVKLILSYTKFYGNVLYQFGRFNRAFRDAQKRAVAFTDCRYKCKWSKEKSDYNRSDAVVYHLYNNLGNKDFVLRNLPTRHSIDQKWVLMIREPPAFYYPEQMKLLNNKFNLTMTFQSRADIHIPYGGYWKKPQPQPPKNYLKNNTQSVVWLVSNCVTSSRREKYVEELEKYIDIDVFGECGQRAHHLKSYKKEMPLLARQYKFYIAFENSDCEDYITEKFWRSLHLGLIPIVRGKRGNYKKFAPPNSYIHADTFLTPENLAEYLKEISADSVQFNKYHRWRQLYDADYVTFTYNRHWMCDLCTQVHTAPRQTVDVYEQFSETTQCFTYLLGYGRNRTGEHMEDIDRV